MYFRSNAFKQVYFLFSFVPYLERSEYHSVSLDDNNMVSFERIIITKEDSFIIVT